MPDEGPSGERVGVELFVGGDIGEEPVPEEEDYAPASGWHRAAQRGWRAARVTQIGQDALNASARLVGEQVGMVVRETLAGIDSAELAQATAAGLRASSIELSFGVKLTAGPQQIRQETRDRGALAPGAVPEFPELADLLGQLGGGDRGQPAGQHRIRGQGLGHPRQRLMR